jgi:acyl-coenzyme A thioesterase PaaI-like protein
VIVCVGCEPLQRCRLGLVMTRWEGDQAWGAVRFPRDCEGAQGVVHGGMVAGALDEACAHVAVGADRLVVTGTLEVRFLHPVPVERDLDVRSWVEDRRAGGRWRMGAAISLPGSDVVLATAAGTFVERDARHWDRYATWLAEQPGSEHSTTAESR